MPIPDFTWNTCTAETYHYRLNALPPAEQHRDAFLLGEASDHHGAGYTARYLAHRVSEGVYYAGSRPITRSEFRILTT